MVNISLNEDLEKPEQPAIENNLATVASKETRF